MAKTIMLMQEEYADLKKKAELLEEIMIELKEANIDKLKKELDAWDALSDEALDNFEKANEQR